MWQTLFSFSPFFTPPCRIPTPWSRRERWDA